MDKLKEHIIIKLRESRQELLSISKEELKGQVMYAWYRQWETNLTRADTVSGLLLPLNIGEIMNGFWEEADIDICLVLRTRIIDTIDQSIRAIDGKQFIKPILDDLIAKVTNTKLSTLLREFNETRVNQPNIACSGFRTILPLIIRERAKKVDPTNSLAIKDDIGFERDIKAATEHSSLFNTAEKKLISRYLKGGDKDSFDNVAHKPNYLIDKGELEDAVTLLNHLLPTITD